MFFFVISIVYLLLPVPCSAASIDESSLKIKPKKSSRPFGFIFVCPKSDDFVASFVANWTFESDLCDFAQEVVILLSLSLQIEGLGAICGRELDLVQKVAKSVANWTLGR